MYGVGCRVQGEKCGVREVRCKVFGLGCTEEGEGCRV